MNGLRLLVFVAVATWSTTALAGPVDLQWTAAPECPSGSYVLAEIGRILGDASGPQRTVRARADVGREAPGPWKVTLATESEGATGRRVFSAESCQALADATALILAMTVNPNVTPPPPPPTPPPPPEPVPAPEPAPREAPPATPPSGPRTRLLRFAVGASFVGESGLLPAASAGPELTLAWLPDRFRVELGATYELAQRATGARDAGEGAALRLWTVGARVGYAWSFGDFTIGPLASADLTHLSASGFGGARSFEQSADFVALGAGGLVSWSPVSRLSIRLSGHGVAPLSRPSFVVVEPAPTPAELVHRPAAITGRAALGIEWQFL